MHFFIWKIYVGFHNELSNQRYSNQVKLKKEKNT